MNNNYTPNSNNRLIKQDYKFKWKTKQASPIKKATKRS
jgi:hypothetical protein